MCDITHWYAWHNPWICVTRIIHTQNITHSRVRLDQFHLTDTIFTAYRASSAAHTTNEPSNSWIICGKWTSKKERYAPSPATATHTKCCNRNRKGKTLKHIATHCNALRHTATHLVPQPPHIPSAATATGKAKQCNTLQHTATHCTALQYNALHRAAIHCITLHHTLRCHLHTYWQAKQHTSPHCNTLQRAATHCNRLQHPATHPPLQQLQVPSASTAIGKELISTLSRFDSYAVHINLVLCADEVWVDEIVFDYYASTQIWFCTHGVQIRFD